MIRVNLSIDSGDSCDVATLAGILRDALEASPRFAEFASFRTLDRISITVPTDDGFYVSTEPIREAEAK